MPTNCRALLTRVINLHTQLRNYKKVETWFRGEVGSIEAQRRLSQAVHLFSVGLNDYASPISTNTSNYVEMVIGNLTTVVKEIYKSGGRKFVLLTLLDFRCLPQSRLSISQGKGRHLKEVASLQKRHNKQLLNLFVELEQTLDGFIYLIHDFNKSLQTTIESPTKYGFKEEKDACCGSGKFRGHFYCGSKSFRFFLCPNPDEYIFWDSAHPTQKVSEQMSYQMWRGSPYQIGSYNMKQLFQLY